MKPITKEMLEMSVREIAYELGTSKSTAHRLKIQFKKEKDKCTDSESEAVSSKTRSLDTLS